MLEFAKDGNKYLKLGAKKKARHIYFMQHGITQRLLRQDGGKTRSRENPENEEGRGGRSIMLESVVGRGMRYNHRATKSRSDRRPSRSFFVTFPANAGGGGVFKMSQLPLLLMLLWTSLPIVSMVAVLLKMHLLLLLLL